MIVITEKAKNKIIEIKKKENVETEHSIRVFVEGGGCSGLKYNLIFDSQIKESDSVFEDRGIKILVDKKSLLYILGTTLDFSDGLNGKGFQFMNPNATRTCGCGESFAV
ncbi:MAG: iron-sulfur cluster assembly accessory protein [Chitinophagaceae bacterium]|nr:iron-sulfur cluster assembly accessory protein [Chitinophagaceae bacterium]